MGVSESTGKDACLHVFEDVNAVPSPTETQTVPREESSVGAIKLTPSSQWGMMK